MTSKQEETRSMRLPISFSQAEVLFAFAKLLVQSCSGIPG